MKPAYTIETEIPAVTDAASARRAIEILLEPTDMTAAEELADLYGIHAYRGEYGSGETYYPKGTVASEYYLEYPADNHGIDIDADGKITEGFWVSSSEMC